MTLWFDKSEQSFHNFQSIFWGQVGRWRVLSESGNDDLFRFLSFVSEEKLSLLTSTSVSNIGIHSLSISWEKPPFYQLLADIKGFKVIYRPLASFDQTEVVIKLANANITKYKMTGLERNETYCVRVLAYNEYGDGEASRCLNVTTAEGNRQILPDTSLPV